MTGRPTKLTPETHESIVRDIGNGVTFVDAAGAAGIDRSTFENWMKRGEEATETGKDKIYFYFFRACQAAKAAARKKFTLVISKAASEGDWRAALEYLKRHDPENWGDRQQTDLNVNDPIVIKVIYDRKDAPNA